MDPEFLADRIAAVKRRIIAYEECIEALSANDGVQIYSLNTGQTTQSVTRQTLGSVEAALERALNSLVTLEARQRGSVSVVGPAW